MPNKNNYIAIDLDNETINDFYKISQELSQKINNFIPFELEQIHMTVCFLGELGKKIKTNKKETFEKLLFDIESQDKISTLQFDSFQLFGTKNNLVVAKFTIGKKEEKKIIEFKKYCAKTYFAPDENYYTPHITLGKILYSSENNDINLNELNITKPTCVKLGNVGMKLVQ